MCGTALLPAAPSRRCGGRTRAAARCRLTARDDFGLVVVRPVVEGDSMSGAACFAAGLATGRLDGVLHMDRPQVGVFLVVLGPIGDEAALHVCPTGWPKQRTLSKERAD